MENSIDTINILHLEDDRNDSFIILQLLKNENIKFNYILAETGNEFISALNNNKIDIILSDYNIPGYSGLEALHFSFENFKNIPFVFVSGTMGEEAVVNSLLNGATDYVLKSNLGKLGSSVIRALNEANLKIEYNNAIEALRLREQQYRILIEGMNECLLLSDLNNVIQFVNNQTCVITGYTSKELIGKKFTELFFEEKQKSLLSIKNELVEHGKKESFQIELIKKNKERIWIRINKSPVFDDNGIVNGSIGVFDDITSQKKAEADLRKLNKAVEQSPDSIVITDINGRIEYANPITVKLTGYSIEELIGKKTSIFSSGKNSKELYRNLWNTITEGKVWEGELNNKKKDGSLYWEAASISPIYGDNSQITHFLTHKVDITLNKKMTEELIISKNKAEESDKLKSAFLANISHEIRTPMNGILGFSELLKNHEISFDTKDRYIHIIEQSGKRMLNIINDIVDISKIEAGQMNLSLAETNLNKIIIDLYQFFIPEAKSKGIVLNYELGLPNELSQIMCDQTKLNQILTNLIKNALKFTNAGRISFGYYIKDENVEFYVKDTGVGIPSNQHGLVFERFRQGSVALSRSYEGAGLGLSISKALIEMLGGKIWLESEPLKGSVFFFTLPVKNLTNKVIENNCGIINAKLNYRYILIVEDEQSSKELLRTTLEFENVMIAEASDGYEAIEMIKNHHEIDLVLLDIRMPGIDGFETARKIKEIRPELPIIAQSAYAFAEYRQKAIDAGCSEFIFSPVKKETMLQILQKRFY